MTPAERKRRSRTLALGALVGHLDLTRQALAVVSHEAVRISPAMAEALQDLELQLDLARDLVPRS